MAAHPACLIAVYLHAQFNAALSIQLYKLRGHTYTYLIHPVDRTLQTRVPGWVAATERPCYSLNKAVCVVVPVNLHPLILK